MVKKIDYPSLEVVQWSDVREAVHKVNPALAKIMDSIKHVDELVLYKAKYAFGMDILRDSKFYVPHNGVLSPIDHPLLPRSIKQDLDYSQFPHRVPLGMVLNHSIELDLRSEDRINPFSLYTKGQLFGLWGALSLSPAVGFEAKVWDITAGGRCVFLLPKIQDAPSYKKLCKKRNVKRTMPRTLLDQGPMLAQMAQHKNFTTPWTVDLLFFSKNFLERNDDVGIKDLRLFLYEVTWDGTDYWRNNIVYDLIWDIFVKDLTARHIKVMPYIVDMVRHIIATGLGVIPGFSPAIDDEVGPMESLKADFVDIYGLKRFAPTIMIPKYLSLTDGRPVYWSLQLPSYFESTPKPKRESSIVDDLKSIKSLLEKFREAVLNGKIPIVVGTHFYDFLNKVEFDFFHSDGDIDEGIRSNSEMPKEDKTLIQCAKTFGRREFSEISPFTRGCVRIILPN
jgi:hypothetical protein